MNDPIATTLTRLFEQHRIVFWHDAELELRDAFEALDLPDVTKVVIDNNEFGVKYRILRQEPEQRFLLYRFGPEPAPLDNWLLDVQLGQGRFRTDQIGMWLTELELGPEFADLLREHAAFFNAESRRSELAAQLARDDSENRIRMRMLAVTTRAEARLDAILEALLAERAKDSNDRMADVERFSLADFLWQQLERTYDYRSEAPGIDDFAIELFKSCLGMDADLHEAAPDWTVKLNNEAQVFLQRWKDSRRHGDAFETHSQRAAQALDMDGVLGQLSLRALTHVDLFELVDRKVIADLVRQVTARTIPAGGCQRIIRQRRQGYWHERYSDLYGAVDAAASFLARLDAATLESASLADGFRRYASDWYLLDQDYRGFVYHLRAAGQQSLLAALAEMVENHYSNRYLLPLNDHWQQHVDAADSWTIPGVTRADDFFATQVRPFMQRQQKICVIISDAMRYEVGDELVRRIRRENRYDATLSPMLSMLPSYTQLGMAALLPHEQLEIAADKSATVVADGKSTVGTAAREKILQHTVPAARAVQADTVLGMSRDGDDGYRTLFSKHDVVYVYHNRIDSVGDKRDSEERTFEAVEDALAEVILIVKKLTAANASHILLTADHGFLYQHRALAESDFSGSEARGSVVQCQDRRFVLGQGLQQQPGLRHFAARELGLDGEGEVQIAKSINRMRLRGSGSRYVHGGASLQEVVIPVLQIHKTRRDDVAQVDVEILRGGSSLITSGQLAVALYQQQPATEKVQGRRLKAGLFDAAGNLISDQHELEFDYSSQEPRERELQIRFVLSRAAEGVNNQEVTLRLEEQVGSTSHYQTYKTMAYTLRRAISSDFEL